MNDLKYLAAFTIPITSIIGLIYLGYFTYLTPIYAFVILPIVELLSPTFNNKLSKTETEKKLNNRIFDWLLYLNLPIVYGLLVTSLYVSGTQDLETFEFIGSILSVGIVIGVNGINVGHELGHRQQTNERFIGKALLFPALYMHFYIEHNYGHHLNVATKEDPATARYNQSVYAFWAASVSRQYVKAWQIQLDLLKRWELPFFSLKNDMLWYLVLQTGYLMAVFIIFGFKGLLFAFSVAAVGFLLLETVNYIEHYGLLRTKLPSGRYEHVREIHSWNSNHIIGRIVLYELTRHSDHHFKSSKKYQILECQDDSPQMPLGYPTSMVMALCPPIWFKVMNKYVPHKMIQL